MRQVPRLWNLFSGHCKQPSEDLLVRAAAAADVNLQSNIKQPENVPLESLGKEISLFID